MIDTKELRRLLEEDGKNNIDLDEIHELIDRLEVAETAWKEADKSCYDLTEKVIPNIRNQLEAAEKEIILLRIALAEKVTRETTLRDLSVGNGSINATFEGGAVQLMVDALADQFVESGAPNYIEMQFHSEATGPLLFTLQRVNGKTPHQLRAEAEKERAGLAEKLAAANRAVEEAYQRGYATGQEEIETERDELRTKLEAAEKSDAESLAMYRKARDEREGLRADLNTAKQTLEVLIPKYTQVRKERLLLRARIAEMEKQEPFDADHPEFRRAFDAALKTGNWPTERKNFGYRSPMSQMAWQVAFCTVNNLKLYTLPGAQAQNVSSVPDGVAEAMQRLIENGAVLGPASSEDALLVARYRQRLLACAPSVPDKVDVREDKEEEMFSRGSYNEGYDNGWNDCIDAMLAAARERRTSHDL